MTGRLSGIRVSKLSPRVNHLLFADDTMFFCKASEKEARALLHILAQYEAASGQTINKTKSAITFSSKLPQEIRAQILKQMDIEKEGGVGKYLGLPEYFGRKKKDMFTSIVDRIKQKAISWSAKHLSAAGKYTMLKSVLTAIPTYAMMCFQLPKSLTKRIQSALTRFWWDANSGRKKMCWVAWKELAKPKALGGLGFRDIEEFNEALLAKLAWRILTNPQCLLSRVLNGKYNSKGDFMEARTPTWSSHGWRSIMCGRDVLKTHTMRAIGNGEEVRVWQDKWLPIDHCRTPIGPSLQGDETLKVADLLNQHTKEWDIAKIRELFPDLEDAIQLIKPSKSGGKDSFLWPLTASGHYSTKSGYYALLDAREKKEQEQDNNEANATFKWVNEIWKRKVSPKLHIFLWKVAHKALPVGANLSRRGINQEGGCIRCNKEETQDHLLFECEFAQQFWLTTMFPTNQWHSQGHDFLAKLQMTKGIKQLPPTGIVETDLFVWCCWTLWQARNQLLFQKKPSTIWDCNSSALRLGREWDQAQSAKPESKRQEQAQPRQRLEPNSPLLFTDAAWDKTTGRAGISWIIRDSKGEQISSGGKSISHINSALMAEAQGILHGLTAVLARNLTRITIFSDSANLVKAINAKTKNNHLLGVLSDIDHLRRELDSTIFSWIPRIDNTQADLIAKQYLVSFNEVVECLV